MTDPEWEYAARSPDGRDSPWGDRWVPGSPLVLSTLGPALSPRTGGWAKTDISGYRVHDLAGGSSERRDVWTSG